MSITISGFNAILCVCANGDTFTLQRDSLDSESLSATPDGAADSTTFLYAGMLQDDRVLMVEDGSGLTLDWCYVEWLVGQDFNIDDARRMLREHVAAKGDVVVDLKAWTTPPTARVFDDGHARVVLSLQWMTVIRPRELPADARS
jgi:hypothetical protein